MSRSTLSIVIPVFRDWESAAILLQRLDEAFATEGVRLRVLLVDDGSWVPTPVEALRRTYACIRRVEILHLKRNLGHQRAIACGLVWVHEHVPESDTVLVMDADGEDRPEDAVRLYRAFRAGERGRLLFAARRRRSERWSFRLFYVFYRLAFRILTGERMRYGNFCIMGRDHLAAVVLMPEIWVNFPAAITRSRLPYDSIPSTRGTRYRGESRMDMVALLLHGLSSICVYNDVIGIRLFWLVGGLLMVLCAALFSALAAYHFHPSTLPLWIDVAIATLIILFFLVVSIGMNFLFTLLGSRANMMLLPLRDSAYLMGSLEVVYSADDLA